VKEAVLARRIERAFTKGQILELYLNEIYFGLRSHGIAAAALNYFGKSLEEISIQEAAYLASLPKAPNNYHPFKKRKRAIIRRKYVIKQMLKNGYITKAEADAAIASEFKVNPRPFGAHILAGEFFAEGVRRKLIEKFGQKRIYGGGLSVRTTLDPDLQKKAKKALVDGLVSYDQKHGFRGAVAEIVLTPEMDWGIELAKVEALQDVHPWRLGIVLKLEAKKAVIGLQPKQLVSGQVDSAREIGEISLDNMKWARKHLGETKYGDPKLGKVLKSPGSILKLGDVVYVAPVKAKLLKKAVASTDAVLPVEGNNQWKLMQIPEVEGAIVVMEPHTGRVKALVGGFSFDDSEFDRATQAKRQPGSAFKPFVYAAALDNGYTPSSVVLDTPVAIDQGNGQGIWRPKNYSGKFNGPSTLRIGIEKSRNLMTVRLAQDMGMPLISEYARRFGIYDNLMPVLSMSLGAGETTLMRLTTAYSILANGGKKVNATLIDRIQDRYGKTVWSHDAAKCDGCDQSEWDPLKKPQLIDQREQIIDPHTAYQVTSMLEGVVLRGTARKAMKGLPIPVAGKTGTTNDARDAWFVGFSADLAVGVFVGQDVPRPMGKKATGGGLAAPIFKNFMMSALAGKPAIPFRIPAGIKLIPINSKSGLRSSGGQNTIMEAFKPGNGPPDASSVIYDDPSIFIPETDRSLDSGLY
jgi:penicillin-binding protein 1A